jgi:hypothetical protein
VTASGTARRDAQLRKDLGGVAEQRDGFRLACLGVLLDAREGVVEVGGLLVDVARAQAHVDARLLAFDVERARAGERRGQRLRAAHAAEARGEDPLAGEVAAVVLAAHLDEGFVRALHDALRADVDPRAGRHLAVHHQALLIELVEVLPRRPVRDEVGVRASSTRAWRSAWVGKDCPTGLAHCTSRRFVGRRAFPSEARIAS